MSAPDPGSFQSTFYDMVVINLGQGIFKVEYNDEIYNIDSGYSAAAESTPPYLHNQAPDTRDPKIGFNEDGPRALGLTASSIILVDRSIINRIVYVPAAVFINVGLASPTKNDWLKDKNEDGTLDDPYTPEDVGFATITSGDYSYLTSNEILFIESLFKDADMYDIFGFLLLPFDGIDLRVPVGEVLSANSEVEIVLNWDITDCLELDVDGTPYFAKRASAGGDLPFDFDVDVIVRR